MVPAPYQSPTIAKEMTTRDANAADVLSAFAKSPGILLSLTKTGASALSFFSLNYNPKKVHGKISLIKDSYSRISGYNNIEKTVSNFAKIGKTTSLVISESVPKNLQEALEKACFIAVEIFANLTLSIKGLCGLATFWTKFDISYIKGFIGPISSYAQLTVGTKNIYKASKKILDHKFKHQSIGEQAKLLAELSVKVGGLALTTFGIISGIPWVATASFLVTGGIQVINFGLKMQKEMNKKIEIEDTSHLINPTMQMVV